MRDTGLRFLLAVVTTALGACEDPGEPPVIADLELSPDEIPLNEVTNVNADFTFEDPDGDVEEMLLSLEQGGQVTEMTAPVSGGGLTSGPARLVLVTQASSPGAIDLELRVRDEGGNVSNTLSATLTAVEEGDNDCEEASCGQAEVEIRLQTP